MVLGVESTTIVLLEASERVFLFLLASGREEPIMDGVLGSSWGMYCATLRYASVLWEVRYASYNRYMWAFVVDGRVDRWTL